MEKWRTATKEESDYFDEIEAQERLAEEEFAMGGGFELSKGDYEGAIMARHEYYWGGDGGLL